MTQTIRPRTAGVTFNPLDPKPHLILPHAKVVYEPSVYGGDGTETRVNLVLRVPSTEADELREKVRTIETALGLEPRNSVIAEDTIKAKLPLDQVRAFDQAHEPIEVPAPARWKGATINARLEIKGSWQSRMGSGLSIVCTDVQFLTDSAEAPPTASPFLEYLEEKPTITVC